MFFGKRRKPGAPAYGSRRVTSRQQPEQDYITITFDMMQKGHIVKRKRETVRQYTVMVGNRIRTVTSGEVVDRLTWDALVKAGAVEPESAEQPEQAPPDGEEGPPDGEEG